MNDLSSLPIVSQRVRQPSIVDVANLARVSSKTVSNVIHDRGNVRPTTRKRVQQAIDELGYRPNLISRQLRTGRSNNIILAVPELVTTYFSQLAHEVMQSAQKSGLESCTADGVILSSLTLTGQEAWENRTGLPVVLLGERSEDSPITHIQIDNRASARQATEHVLARGCIRPLFLGLNIPNDTG